jgi:hypothetical protein
MPTWYRKLEPAQEPFDEGTDGDRRAIVGFNVDAEKHPSPTWLQELAGIFVDNGFGVIHETILLSSSTNIPGDGNSEVPGGDGPFITITDTGGSPREHIHNSLDGYQRPSAKVRVHARLYLTAYNLAFQLHAKCIARNRNFTPAQT